jgi:hypothetical protein
MTARLAAAQRQAMTTRRRGGASRRVASPRSDARRLAAGAQVRGDSGRQLSAFGERTTAPAALSRGNERERVNMAAATFKGRAAGTGDQVPRPALIRSAVRLRKPPVALLIVTLGTVLFLPVHLVSVLPRWRAAALPQTLSLR